MLVLCCPALVTLIEEEEEEEILLIAVCIPLLCFAINNPHVASCW